MTLRICSRSKDVIEPLLKPQWYVNMKDMAAKAHEAVESGELIINPKLSENDFKRWMDNIRDWCISRQLWWGHQAPVYFVKIEGAAQSVRSPSCRGVDSRLQRANGGLPLDLRKRQTRGQLQNSPVKNLLWNEITMFSIPGSPPVFGPFPLWAGRT